MKKMKTFTVTILVMLLSIPCLAEETSLLDTSAVNIKLEQEVQERLLSILRESNLDILEDDDKVSNGIHREIARSKTRHIKLYE